MIKVRKFKEFYENKQMNNTEIKEMSWIMGGSKKLSYPMEGIKKKRKQERQRIKPLKIAKANKL